MIPNKERRPSRRAAQVVALAVVTTLLAGGASLTTAGAVGAVTTPMSAPNLADGTDIVADQFTYGWYTVPNPVDASTADYQSSLYRAKALTAYVGRTPAEISGSTSWLAGYSGRSYGGLLEAFTSDYPSTKPGRANEVLLRPMVDVDSGDVIASSWQNVDGATSYTFPLMDVHQVVQSAVPVALGPFAVVSKYSSFTRVVTPYQVFMSDAMNPAVGGFYPAEETTDDLVLISQRFGSGDSIGPSLLVNELDAGVFNSYSFNYDDYGAANTMYDNSSDAADPEAQRLCALSMMVEYAYKALQTTHCYDAATSRACSAASAASVNYRNFGYYSCAALGQV